MEFDDDDDDIIFDDAALAHLDAIDKAAQSGLLPRKSGPVELPNLKQKTLFGTVAQPLAGSSKAVQPVAKTKATKKWDFSSFARLGWSKKRAEQAKSKAKGKKKAYASDEEPWDEEEDVLDDDGAEEEALIEPVSERLPIKWPPDPAAVKTWHYPVQPDKPLRTYQYNIAYKCLLDNTLVSLPTGLGKTFIAACVMLNFYRWYPKGKIIFLAPTRPLVTQQIKACHYIAGIPQSDCIELTGQTPATLRGVAWATKRVIYCTPQTLENDLRKGRIDARDVVLLVIDEAHRASGDYAYCGVVRFVMSRNEHFRVLALTATPGARGEAVQDVINSLHIGHVEVRTDTSIDIKPYMHQKSYDLCIIELKNTPIAKLTDSLAALMQVYQKPLLAARLIYDPNPLTIAPFSVQRAYSEVGRLPGNRAANGKFFPMIKSLHSLARAMEYLLVHSVTSCAESLEDACAGNKNLASRPEMRQLKAEINSLRGMPGYVGHPKMQRLRQMCEQHFTDAEKQGHKDTRVMVFCNYRNVVEEIVDCLNALKPLIKATRFIGQGTAKGVRGKTQKEQIETIKKFKEGVYNVLVATSIGEEGLDIGEIDLIVCYEANKSPVRMLQRVGRTGRARDGKIIVFMSEGREERNWEKAKDAYSEVQNALTSNKVFELYSDGDRMLPANVKPECVKVDVKAAPLDLEAITMAGQNKLVRKATAESKKAAKKAPRDPKANVPKDAFMGFRAAGDLQKEKERKKAKSSAEIMRERKEAALLTVDEEVHLRKWQFVGGSRKVKPEAIDTYNLPFHEIPSRLPGRKSDLVSDFLQSSSQILEMEEDSFDPWHERMSAAFKGELVDPFQNEKKARPHPDLRRRVAQPEEPKTFTQYALQSSRTMLSSDGVKPSLPKASLQRATSTIVPAPRPTPKMAAAPMSSAKPILDPHGILSSSSSDEDLPQLARPKIERTLTASTDYGLANDSIDPVKLEEIERLAKSKIVRVPSQPAPMPKHSDEIVIPDSDEGELELVQPKPPTKADVSTDFDMLLSDEGDAFVPDEAMMRPPPVPVRTRTVERPRYQRHVVPESSSSVGKSRTIDDDSPIKVVKKRTALGTKHRKNVVESEGSSDSSAKEAEPVRPRKKLRRAGERRPADENTSIKADTNTTTKTRKKKLPKVTDKDLARHGMLDFEAVNSEASGAEASTESYDSENSIDRHFVAVDESIDVDADQAQFYRDSLLTQHPDFAPNPWKRNLLQPRGRAQPSTPESHVTQDDWSYDSFCRPDDEPIEEDTSSQQ